MIIKCNYCGQEFEKLVGNINQNKKHGRKNYCSNEHKYNALVGRKILWANKISLTMTGKLHPHIGHSQTLETRKKIKTNHAHFNRGKKFPERSGEDHSLKP